MAPVLSKVVGVIVKALSPIPKYQFSPSNDDSTEETGIVSDVQNLSVEDYKTLVDILRAEAAGEEDDDQLLLERTVTLLAKLPPHSAEGKRLTDGLVNTLWSSLEHPPPRVRTSESRYRTPDGSCNKLSTPMMGAANTAYAQTTPARVFQGPNLPEPGLIFDTLLTRGNGSSFREHPNKISSMLFYLAIIITHDCFQTDPRDRNVNLTSSYLDLSPLYGRNDIEQKAMRTFKNGLLKPDCFSSKALLDFPPGVAVFLMMFNRFHNYVVTQLATINEANRFAKPNLNSDLDNDEALKRYDHDLFQTGRLITCGLYVNIILRDYVRTILNLNRTDSTWALDPRAHEKRSAFNTEPAPEATGNQVSVEFNLIYRWHSTTSLRDEKWITRQFRDRLGGKDPAQATMDEVLRALAEHQRAVSKDPLGRVYAGLERGDDGTYSDGELVDILTASIEDIAGAFGANQVPSALRIVEVLGMTQARKWHVATLNEFRQHFGLKKHDTFEDINPDPVVASKLMALYDSPDAVELYPGLVSEKPKPPMAGSGLCVNVTTSRAILSDAVALVRGDRFYTTDYTPSNLTHWGFNEADFDTSVNQGHVMHKLIFRAFPNSFDANSIYAHFPFVVPSENEAIHKDLGTSWLYSWETPTTKMDHVIVNSFDAARKILNNKTDFHVPWGKAILYLVSPPGKSFGKDFCLAGDGAANEQNRQHVSNCLFQPKKWEEEIRIFMAGTMKKLLKKASHALPINTTGSPSTQLAFEADIIRDVIITAMTRFFAALYGLPIKTTETSPHGIYTEQELYGVLNASFMAVFFNGDPASSFKLRNLSRKLTQDLEQLMVLKAEAGTKAGWITSIATRLGLTGSGKAASGEDHDGYEWPSLPDYGMQMLYRFMEQGKTIEECMTTTFMPISTAGTTNTAGTLCQCVDYFLGAGSDHLEDLRWLALEDTPEADDTLMHYMYEGIRLGGTVLVARNVFHASPAQAIADDLPCLRDPTGGPSPIQNPDRTSTRRTYSLKPSQRAIINLVGASHDAKAFPSPSEFRLDRPLDSYLFFGLGPHRCIGEGIAQAALLAAFKVIFQLPGLRRASGRRGECRTMDLHQWRGQVGRRAVEGGEGWTGIKVYMTADEGMYWPVPTTMRVRWDEEADKKTDEAREGSLDWVRVDG
ncbi:linoleate diol synthase precursor [Xylariaceae sp. FL0016]|nr:linoleate diol synthase precursor [Xylariaceae sp. FL0016]